MVGCKKRFEDTKVPVRRSNSKKNISYYDQQKMDKTTNTTLHRKLKTVEHEFYYKTGMNSTTRRE
jgi:hypothetical protein